MYQNIEKMRKRLRLKTSSLDDEIGSYIKAGLLELKRVGVSEAEADLTDELLFTCIEFYCKWLMNFEGEGEKYETAFEKVRDSLAMSGGDPDEAHI